MFRVSQHQSSGVLKTVTVTSGTGHNTGKATSLQRGLIGTEHVVNKYLKGGGGYSHSCCHTCDTKHKEIRWEGKNLSTYRTV